MSSARSNVAAFAASASVLVAAVAYFACSQATDHPPPASDGNSPTVGIGGGAGTPPPDGGGAGVGAGPEPGAGGAAPVVDAGVVDGGVGTGFGAGGGIPGAAGLGATGTGETVPPVVHDDAGSGIVIVF